jgi:hypothetical protein
MKNNFVYVAATTLMATGMMFATTVGALPASTPSGAPSGWASTVNPAYTLPGVESTQETPNAGISLTGVIPGTGVQSGERGSAAMNTNLLPGVDTSSTLKSMNNF